jgi:hypothetical protein
MIDAQMGLLMVIFYFSNKMQAADNQDNNFRGNFNPLFRRARRGSIPTISDDESLKGNL